MKKKALSLVLSLVMCLSLLPSALAAGPAEAMPTNDKLTVDGVLKNPTVYKIGGSNYFKIRDLAAILNGTSKQFSVGYDNATNAVTVTTGQGYTKQSSDLAGAPTGGNKTAVPSNDAIYVNGNPIEVKAYKIGGNNYFKLRDLGEALGFNVGWSAERGVFLETGSAPAEDGKITLADLQGVWIATLAPYDWELYPKEFVISDNQYTWAVMQEQNNHIINGTITEFDNDFQGDIEGVNYVLYWDGTRYILNKQGGIDKSGDDKYFSGRAKLQIRTINLAENYIIDTTGYRYDRVESPTVTNQVQAQLNAALNRDSVYEFLADYVTTHGKMTTYGDFKGQYACYLDLYGSLGTNKDWTYEIYADPDTGLVTLGASFSSYSGGAYSISNGTFYSLKLSPDGGPYRGSFRSSTSTSSSILGGWTDTGTFHIDPASFTDRTEALSFDSYDGHDQSFDAENGAVNVRIMLKALRNEILRPKGYTLGDLGFTSF